MANENRAVVSGSALLLDRLLVSVTVVVLVSSEENRPWEDETGEVVGKRSLRSLLLTVGDVGVPVEVEVVVVVADVFVEDAVAEATTAGGMCREEEVGEERE